jgi:hypothetical protein
MDASWLTLGTGLVAGLGLGSIITAQVQHWLGIKETAYESQRRDLEARYKVIIRLIYAAVDFTPNETARRIHRPDLKNQADVLNDLRAEWTNMLLFTSKPTLDNLRLLLVIQRPPT